MNSPDQNTDEHKTDDAEIAELLRQVGPRAEPSIEVTREVEAAVRAEWQQLVGTRKRRNTTVWYAAAASVCAVAIAVTIGLQVSNSRAEPIAVLQRADGEIFVAADGRQWRRLGEGEQIAVGDHVRSDARAALNLSNGLALRIDRGTVLEVESSERLALNVGAVYVDAPAGAVPRELTIDTHLGSVRHVGTQYQVRATAEGIAVSVREGRVVIENDNGSNIATAGERLQLSTHGAVERGAVSPTDAQWQWASDVAPPFVIENQPLSAFLTWVSRETGRALVYESPRAAASAAEVTLHGSIEGLAPDVALVAVLASTPLRRDESNANAIEIELAPSIDPAQEARPTL
jgi:ferric-dicitrate binding protein FerR (iron transport regulator)